MKVPPSGSLVSNVLLFGIGVLCGAVGYWVIDGDPSDDAKEVQLRTANAGSSDSSTHRLQSEVKGGSRSGRADLPRVFSLEDETKAALMELDPYARAQQLREAGMAGARDDIRAALDFGLTLKRLQDRLDYHRGVFAEWTDIDPEAALDHAKRSFNPGLVQSEMIGLVVNKWAATDPQDARVWSEQNLSGPLREQALTDLMVGWTRRSPELASSWVTQSGSGTQPLISAVGTTWAEQDPIAAANWALELPASTTRRAAAVAVAMEWSRQDPQQAADFFSEAVAGPEGLDLATVIADVWGTSDPASTADWIADLPEGAVRDQAAGTLATVWASRDIEAASEWSQSIESPSMRQQVIAHLGTTWGALEPDRAIEWLAQLPVDEAQLGLKGAFNSWGVVDRAGMMDWVESSDPSDIVDQARRSLADVVSQDDILTAIDLSMGISNSTTRNDAVARYYRHWRKLDDASAQEWIGVVWGEIPADMKDRLDREQRAIVVPKN